MPQPTISDGHIDRPLTNIAIGFMQEEADFVARRFFPEVMVNNRSDKYFEYNRAEWLRTEATRRAPGTESAGSGFSVTTSNYSCERDSVHKDLDDPTRANADSPLSLNRDAARHVMRQLLIKEESRWAAKYWTTSVWNADTTPGTLWDDAASDPIGDVKARIRTMLTNTGKRPNRFGMGIKVFDDLSDHPDIVDRVKYTGTSGNPAKVDEQALASLFNVEEVLVLRATNNTAGEQDTASYSMINSAVDALLVFAPRAPSIFEPMAGATFVWRQQGTGGTFQGPVKVKNFRMEKIESDRIEAERWYDQKVVSSVCGEFFDNAVSA